MFNLVPFNKRNDLVQREDFFNNVFDQFFREDFFAPFNAAGNRFLVDLSETKDAYIIKADLPGVKKEDISINMANNYLTISAKRSEESETVEGQNYLRKERRYGEFDRRFYVKNIQAEKIDAEFKDGVLTVSLPKETGSADNKKTITIR